MKKIYTAILLLFLGISFINEAKAQFTNDLGIVALISPVSSCSLSLETIIVQIQNFGTATAQVFPVMFTVNCGNPYSMTFAGIIAPGASVSIALGFYNFSLPGTYLITVFLLPDGNNANNTMQFVVVKGQNITSFPYLEDFESTDACWTAESAFMNDWQWGVPGKPTIDSAYSGTKVWITGLVNNYAVSNTCYLVTSPIDFSNLINPVLSFYLNIKTTPDVDAMILEVSLGGGPWIKVVGDPGFYNNSSWGGLIAPPKWSGNSQGWQKFQTSVAAYSGISNVRFRFDFNTGSVGSDEGIAIDDFSIIEEGPNLAVTALESPQSDCSLGFPVLATMQVKNVGNEPAYGLSIRNRADALSYVVENYQDTILPGQISTYTFVNPLDFTLPGKHTLVVGVSNPMDLIHSNDSVIRDLYTVEPLNNPPLIVDFESNTWSQYIGLGAGFEAEAKVMDGIGLNNQHGIRLSGGEGKDWPSGTGYSTTYDEAFAYQDHISNVYSCDVSLSGAFNWELVFDLRQTFAEGPKHSWLRVLKDDTIVLPEKLTSQLAFNPLTPLNDPFVARHYSLADYTNPFNLKIQAVNRLGSENSISCAFDQAIIDNLGIDFYLGLTPPEELSVLSYPNPANDLLNVKLSRNINSGIVEIRNMQGQLQLVQPLNGSRELTIDLKRLPAGVFSIVIKGSDALNTVKFIKTK
jgi:hypothetical protein